MNNYIFYSDLARQLTNKWKIEGKLPEYEEFGKIYDKIIWSAYYIDLGSKGYNFVLYDSHNYRHGPIISCDEVIKELWTVLNNAEKTEIMAEVLGSKNER